MLFLTSGLTDYYHVSLLSHISVRLMEDLYNWKNESKLNIGASEIAIQRKVINGKLMSLTFEDDENLEAGKVTSLLKLGRKSVKFEGIKKNFMKKVQDIT